MNFEGTVMEDFEDENLVLLDRTTTTDGFGGFEVVWREGATFRGVLTQPKNLSKDVANALTNQKSYTLVTGTTIKLKEGTYFRRQSDGKNFVLKHDNYDRLAPDDSALQMRFAPAEEVALPND